jgi:Fe-S oxidoreductase
MQLAAIIVSLVLIVVGVALFGRALLQIWNFMRLGQPVPAGTRTDNPVQRTLTVVREFLGHTRMNRWGLIGVAHWFVAVGFFTLLLTIVNAIGQLFKADWLLPVLGEWAPYNVYVEFIGTMTILGILTLIVVRQLSHPRKPGRKSRFAGSNFGQAYFVETVILIVGVCIFMLHALEGAQHHVDSYEASFFISYPVVKALAGLDVSTLQNLTYFFAGLKIATSFIWMIVVGLKTDMGVAWHRFLAFPNIYFKRNATGETSLGALLPMTSGGKPIDFEDPGEDDVFGVSQVEQFSWKGLLDFSTCTECGRCQSQCPAWNTGKPLSPKLLIMSLRDHAFAKAPYLLAGGGKTMEGEEKASEEQLAGVPAAALAEAERPLVGTAEENGVIDPDVLWSCTTCGACVEQCPVDIEHIDHIVDMRRYQVLIESSFPKEANVMLRNLERAGDPWGRGTKARLEWTAGLPFEVRVFGAGGEERLPDDVEYLFWVGCAGALDDGAKRTTRAVVELLHEAGVEFMVLGSGEKCTGDPARRLGQEFLFQELAKENVETLNTVGAKKIVVTCAHCFNAISNEYPQLGGDYEVVHHTQLLSRLVADGRLVPAHPVDTTVTYHDPCYLGRHNRVFSPPRDILGSVPGVRFNEMERNQERSFCCGAGGARMWMEETIGTRINEARTDQALETGAEVVAAACPYCITMLSDGVATRKQQGKAAETVRVTDVSELLLRSVRGSKDA